MKNKKQKNKKEKEKEEKKFKKQNKTCELISACEGSGDLEGGGSDIDNNMTYKNNNKS